MEVQARLMLTPVSPLNSLRNNSFPLIVKSPACIITRRHRIFASNPSITAPKREKPLNHCPKAGERCKKKSRHYRQRNCLVAGKKALEDAALGTPEERSKIDKERAGVLVGSGIGVVSDTYKCAGFIPLLMRADVNADLMIAGGVEASVIPLGIVMVFAAVKSAGVLVMESLEHAMKRGAPILAEYVGGAINSDAYHITIPRSDGLNLSACVQSCLVDANVSAEEVNYINAHATSTPIGDLAEVKALKKVFRNTNGIKMNATKSMIGHSMGADGGLEAIATIKSIQTGWLHPTINQFPLQTFILVLVATIPSVASAAFKPDKEDTRECAHYNLDREQSLMLGFYDARVMLLLS
ncbi:3-oxoacyl-[acyl-carrier-protein] synthase 2 [Tanacetum coccineum]